jgi:hypothetical protein
MYSQFSFVISALTFITMVLGNAAVGTAAARSIAAGIAAYLLFVVGDLAVGAVVGRSDEFEREAASDAAPKEERVTESRNRNDSGEAIAA